MTDTLYGIWGSTLTGIANAIRTKNPDVTGLVNPADMRQDILDISGGGEPYIPMKQLISEFNFKTATPYYAPYYDIVKEINLATNMRGMSAIQGTGLMCNASGAKLRTGTNFDYAGIYEIEIPFGTFDRTTAVRNGNNFILGIGRSTYALMLCYQYNSSTDTGKWWIHDQTGANVYLDYGDDDPYFFENKTLHLFYGAKIVNGEIVRDAGRGYFYVNGVQLNSVGAYLTGDIDNGVQVFILGDNRGSGGFIGAVYESLKIWEYRYNLDDTDDIIQPITITANGTYTANGNTVAGYSPITVNVHEVLESEFDLLHCNSTDGYPDLVKDVYIPTNNYRGFANGYLTDRNGSVRMNVANTGDIKRFVIKMGTFDRSQEPSATWLSLLSFGYDTNIWCLYYDTEDDKWLLRDAGGQTDYLSGNDLPKYALENATVEVIFGARYINGTLYRGKKVNGAITESYKENVTMYIHATNNQEYVIEYTGIMSDGFTCRIGRGYDDWVGAKFENAKIYNVLDCYDKYYEEPVSLMSASPSEEETE